MFNVTRSEGSLQGETTHYIRLMRDELHRIFHGKCYLCEDAVTSSVVEHFKAHRNNIATKYDWNNLYLSCRRCNNIKGGRDGFLDCCKSKCDVFRAIRCLCPQSPGGDFRVTAQRRDEMTRNTADLLHLCYNQQNTSLRGISQAALREKIFSHYAAFIARRRELCRSLAEGDCACEARKTLLAMTAPAFPFSVFWKWHILEDAALRDILKNDITW